MNILGKVSIKNFKSVRDLEFSPKRVNVFIGEPNTGKSNILEALAVFSEGIYDIQGDNFPGEAFRDVLRFKKPSDLFFDRELSETIKVVMDGFAWTLKFEASQFDGKYVAPHQSSKEFKIFQSGQLEMPAPPDSQVRYYRFKTLPEFNESRFGTLRAPYGRNLAAILTTNKRLRGMVSDLFRQRGFRLNVEPEKNEFGMMKVVEDQFYTFSYPTISETFRRIIFFMAVFETNNDAVLLLDEPETNTFPFYTAYLAERIALDESNQFFLTTHNPYILSSIVSKTPMKDLAVFVASMDDFRTKLKPVSANGLSKILDYGPDAFLNLDKLVEE